MVFFFQFRLRRMAACNSVDGYDIAAIAFTIERRKNMSQASTSRINSGVCQTAWPRQLARLGLLRKMSIAIIVSRGRHMAPNNREPSITSRRVKRLDG